MTKTLFARFAHGGALALGLGLTLLTLAAAAVIGIAGPAFAQGVVAAAQAPTTTIDLSGPIIGFLTVAGTIGTSVAFFVVKYLIAKAGATGIVKDDVIRKYLTEGFEYAVHFAVSRLATADWTKVDTKNAAIAQAAGYILDHFPDALDYFGYDTKKLSSVIEARLSAAYPDLVANATEASAEPGVA